MIDKQVQELHDSFLAHWTPISQVHPVYSLDGSFLSMGVVDRIVALVGGDPAVNSSPTVVELRTEAIAVLACYIEKFYLLLGKRVKVVFGSSGISIEAENPNLEGEADPSPDLQIHLQEKLVEMFEKPPAGLSLFHKVLRALPQYGNWIHPILLGILAGSSDYIEGCKLEIKMDFPLADGKLMLQELAKQHAAWYERSFPDEPLGQVAELYLNQLIFPPMGYGEQFAAVQAVNGLFEFMQTYSVASGQMRRLLDNLYDSPDELISLSAICFSLALHEGPLTSRIYAAARRHGAVLGLCRPALVEARRLLGKGDDWLNSTEPYSASQREMISHEIRSGFIPWLKISESRLFHTFEDEVLKKLIERLARFDVIRSQEILTEWIEERPDDIEMRVQRLYLDLIDGKREFVRDALRQLLTEPEAESNAALFIQLGNVEFLLGDIQGALKSFERARSFSGSDYLLNQEASNNLAWALLELGRTEEALEVLELSLGSTADDLILRMNRIACLLKLGRNDAAIREQEFVIRLAPFHPKVFLAVAYPLLVEFHNKVSVLIAAAARPKTEEDGK